MAGTDRRGVVADPNRCRDGCREDCRADPNGARYSFVGLPTSVREGLSRLTRRMGRTDTGADFIVRPDGERVFLEADSGPQFDWLESATGTDVVGAMARRLAKGLT
ncbi:hypothetical protein UA75_23755 [Actinoalloteichus sp. GBA129-24]|nr:hypothetical protein UA75_23755 [Actinoalloteichus sp. GBA129-24]